VNSSRGPIDWKAIRLRMEVAEMEMEDALNPPKAQARKIMEARAKALARPFAQAAQSEGVEVVVFTLARETYAVPCRFVREVVALTDYTPVPGVPDFVMGVTNLRGDVLAVMDLRRFFNLPREGVTDLARVVVLGRGRAEFGIVADAALGQVTLPQADIHPARDIAGLRNAFIIGVTKDATLVLDGARLLADERFTIAHHHTDNSRKPELS
jgi:purine-binding chemotaxis protein CheW